MNLKAFYTTLDIIFGTIWGFTIIDIIPLFVLNGGNVVFTNLDNSIKVASAALGLIYFVIRIYFYYHKSKGEIALQKEQIRELEIKNNENDLTNHIFGRQLNDMPIEVYKESKERLKGK